METNDNNANSKNYALHVALQTMKERCQHLQSRLTAVEEENLTLRMNKAFNPGANEDHSKHYDPTEVEVLREKCTELSRQKVQLAEHLSMIAAENRQLWSRLSKITKDNHTNKAKDNADDASSPAAKTEIGVTTTTSQNLIRSKTFTQNAPNPKLREKLFINADLESSDTLENIPLVNSDINQSNATKDMGFGYLHEDFELPENCDDIDLIIDPKICTEGFIEMKKELLRQQSDLKVVLSNLKQKKDLCNSCLSKCKDGSNKSKPETADKNLATENDLANNLPGEMCVADEALGTLETPEPTRYHIDFLEEKRKADGIDKTCPMCGKIYTKNSLFGEFQDHVEAHFIDDTETDISLDRNYEFISHTVGDF